ncbi:hypothetical protein ACH4RG_23355 [Streptomyces sp. NPDC021019]|uniref:hypothetical protein n=1 Tax=Streptomyces sp. NPDC021019 TaxID=3365108 RepID=UPI0037A12177
MTTSPIGAVLQAVAQALRGDRTEGLRLLQPVVDAGPASTYAMLCLLADIAARPARREHGPTAPLGPEVGDPGEGLSVDDLPPARRFAAQFVAAHANGDTATAVALFWAVADYANSNRTGDLAEAIGKVFDMAITAAAQPTIPAASGDGPA